MLTRYAIVGETYSASHNKVHKTV